MKKPIIDEETGEVDEVIEEPELDEPLQQSPLPMLRLVKKDGSTEILAAARTPREVVALFDHACMRIRTEFNHKEKKTKEIQDYVG